MYVEQHIFPHDFRFSDLVGRKHGSAIECLINGSIDGGTANVLTLQVMRQAKGHINFERWPIDTVSRNLYITHSLPYEMVGNSNSFALNDLFTLFRISRILLLFFENSFVSPLERYVDTNEPKGQTQSNILSSVTGKCFNAA